jgi:hypothetical protein
MPSHLLRCSILFLLVATVARPVSTQVATDKPIVNFRLPDFTPEGNRSWLLRGSEARYAADGRIDIKELNLTIFSGQPDDRVETLILSPSAEVRPENRTVRGSQTIRVINDRFEATGTGWLYSHPEKRVSIAKNVHVILHTELKDLLQ